MPLSSRSEAQQRADDIRVFWTELDRLQREGVLALDDAQRRAVAEHQQKLLAGYSKTFDIDRDSQSKQLSLGMRAFSLMGALALAASVFFLFYRFWGLFPATTQVAILLIAALGTFCATALIRERDTTGYFTKLAGTVAFACFVLDIAMLGQIFNVAPSDTALLLWAAFALLLAYAYDLRVLLVAGLLCLVTFLSARTGTWSGIYWLYCGERPENFFPAAIALFAVPLVLDHRRFHGFAATYRVVALLTLFLPMLTLAHWGNVSYLHLDRTLIESFYQALGFVCSGAAIWLSMKYRWPEVANTGLTFFVIFLYTKFFDWWWDIMPKYLFFLVVGLTAVLLLMIFKRLRERHFKTSGDAAA